MSAQKPQQTNDKGVSTWGYVGYDLLYAIPIIGTIFMIIYAFDDSNVARRNYTRSRFIPFLLWGLLIAGALTFALVIYISRGGNW